MSKMEIESNQEEVSSVGDKLKELLRGYGSPKDSKQHAAYAENIRTAIKNRDLDELLEKLEWFGNARCNNPGTQTIEMFCARESYDIINELKKSENIPWDELAASLGISAEKERE